MKELCTSSLPEAKCRRRQIKSEKTRPLATIDDALGVPPPTFDQKNLTISHHLFDSEVELRPQNPKQRWWDVVVMKKSSYCNP